MIALHGSLGDITADDINPWLGVAERGFNLITRLSDGDRRSTSTPTTGGGGGISQEQLLAALANRQTGSTNYIPWIVGGVAVLAVLGTVVIATRR